MRRVAIIDAVRTPIGRYNGALRQVRPDDLGARVIEALLERNPQVDPKTIEEVIFGNANQAGEDNRNVARMSGLLAGLPVEVAGTTINRLCGSGLDAVIAAARGIALGEGDIYIAGGTESMTRAPFVLAKPDQANPRGNQTMYDTTIGWRFVNDRLADQYGTDSMPETAENVARQYGISREAQDDFAFESQQRAKQAIEANRFTEELVAVTQTDRKGNVSVFDRDEHPRPETTREKLSTLRPLFPNGTVTAGNASGVNDGASALLLMSEEKAKALGLTPLGYYRASATAGVEPAIMGIGPIDATKKVLRRAGLTVEQLDQIELNEAFAAQSLACIEVLGLPTEKVNVNGGAIAFGHPLGASGARILTTLLHEMRRTNRTYGLATMCVGVGQGIALVVDREGLI
ncbi:MULTISPECIES: acetyl-CoA C-acyltransferase [Exiguobacterium]|uniref:acetyl-CoA C-acetyltransferase n=1 Tax=Exiguobacterium acetylicum TaxID=41170 RepID=A0ABX8GA96_EXIAC|nr:MULTISPECIES: acetyl-CoA C-acyltransferase [Exiguobacterium]AOS99565.1 beta-ketoadipyl CoA thiolase [Exiguobacterium sp. U13-1]QWB30530.1 acetyl-CoA C-acyltransferase [Exiguobacterium acetylicum]HBQ75635.1 acetyl-CoA C-acyltransferase [Exiguobacterium sp.]